MTARIGSRDTTNDRQPIILATLRDIEKAQLSRVQLTLFWAAFFIIDKPGIVHLSPVRLIILWMVKHDQPVKPAAFLPS